MSDGKRIAFKRYSLDASRKWSQNIWTVDTTGLSKPQQLTNFATTQPVYDLATTGNTIVFTKWSTAATNHTTAILSVNTATKAIKQLTAPVPAGDGYYSTTVSPNGSMIAFSKYTKLTKTVQLILMNIDGSNQRAVGTLIANVSLPEIEEPIPETDYQISSFSTAFASDWSPDGTKLIAGQSRYSGITGSPTASFNTLSIITASNGQSSPLIVSVLPIELESFGSAKWSSDGTSIAFISYKASTRNINTISPDGSNRTTTALNVNGLSGLDW